MERMEDANMCAYSRLGPPFNAYFKSYERADGSSIEVHVHAANTPALSFYSALKFEWHAQMDDGMVVLRRRKPEAPRQLLTSPLPSSLVHQQGAPSLPSPAALRQT